MARQGMIVSVLAMHALHTTQPVKKHSAQNASGSSYEADSGWWQAPHRRPCSSINSFNSATSCSTPSCCNNKRKAKQKPQSSVSCTESREEGESVCVCVCVYLCLCVSDTHTHERNQATNPRSVPYSGSIPEHVSACPRLGAVIDFNHALSTGNRCTRRSQARDTTTSTERG